MLNPLLAKVVAEARIADLRASAARFPATTADAPSTANGARHPDETVTSRPRRLLGRAKARMRIAKPAAAVSGGSSRPRP
jgi:hypothetical protein